MPLIDKIGGLDFKICQMAGGLGLRRMRNHLLQPDPAGELSLDVRGQFWTDSLNRACIPIQASIKCGDEQEPNDHHGI